MKFLRQFIVGIRRTMGKRSSVEKRRAAVKRQDYILNIISTNVFMKMSQQDKITSLTKLINIFETDFGFTPRKLEKALLQISKNLTSDINKKWSEEFHGKE